MVTRKPGISNPTSRRLHRALGLSYAASMCGRYGLNLDIEAIVAAALTTDALEAADPALRSSLNAWIPSADIAPTDRAPIVKRRQQRGPRQLTLASWGITRVAPGQRPGLVINARAETLTTRPLFRNGIPALIPVSGWYEWPQAEPTSGRPRPTWLAQDEGHPEAPTWLAGLAFDDGDSTRFVIMTRPPVAAIAMVHDRMPALVPPALRAGWLDGTVSPSDLVDLPLSGLSYHSVEPRPSRRGPSRAPTAQLDLFGDLKRG